MVNYENIPAAELEEPLAPEPAGRWDGWNWDDGTPEDGPDPNPRRRDTGTPCDVGPCPYLADQDAGTVRM